MRINLLLIILTFLTNAVYAELNVSGVYYKESSMEKEGYLRKEFLLIKDEEQSKELKVLELEYVIDTNQNNKVTSATKRGLNHHTKFSSSSFRAWHSEDYRFGGGFFGYALSGFKDFCEGKFKRSSSFRGKSYYTYTVTEEEFDDEISVFNARDSHCKSKTYSDYKGNYHKKRDYYDFYEAEFEFTDTTLTKSYQENSLTPYSDLIDEGYEEVHEFTKVGFLKDLKNVDALFEGIEEHNNKMTSLKEHRWRDWETVLHQVEVWNEEQESWIKIQDAY